MRILFLGEGEDHYLFSQSLRGAPIAGKASSNPSEFNEAELKNSKYERFEDRLTGAKFYIDKEKTQFNQERLKIEYLRERDNPFDIRYMLCFVPNVKNIILNLKSSLSLLIYQNL